MKETVSAPYDPNTGEYVSPLSKSIEHQVVVKAFTAVCEAINGVPEPRRIHVLKSVAIIFNIDLRE